MADLYIGVTDTGVTIFQTKDHAPVGRAHESYEDGATVARLTADYYSDHGFDVSLEYLW